MNHSRKGSLYQTKCVFTSEVYWGWFWKYPAAQSSINLITSAIQALLVSFCRINSDEEKVLSEAANTIACHLSAILRTVSPSITEWSFLVWTDSLFKGKDKWLSSFLKSKRAVKWESVQIVNCTFVEFIYLFEGETGN